MYLLRYKPGSIYTDPVRQRKADINVRAPIWNSSVSPERSIWACLQIEPQLLFVCATSLSFCHAWLIYKNHCTYAKCKAVQCELAL